MASTTHYKAPAHQSTDRYEMQLIRDRFGSLTIEEYLRQHLLLQRDPVPISQQARETFEREVGRGTRIVSTGGHLGILEWDFPVLLAENVITNLPYVKGMVNAPVAVLPVGRIPFSNASRPGSILFEGGSGGSIGSYSFRGKSRITADKGAPITAEEAEIFAAELSKRVDSSPDRARYEARAGILASRVKEMVKHGGTFREQSEWLSGELWPYLFQDGITASKQPPRFIAWESLALEEGGLLESRAMRERMERLFSGVWGAYDGTYFYYGSCRCGREFSLHKEEEGSIAYLSGRCIPTCGHYGSRDYRVDVMDIPEALRSGELHDTLLTFFYKTWALAGIDVIGGFNQADYLATFKQKLISLFDESGEHEKAEILKGRRTDLFNTGLVLAFNKDGSPKSGSRVMLEGGLDASYLDSLLGMNLGHVMDVSRHVVDSIIEGKKPDTGKLSELIRLYSLTSLIR